MTNNKKKRNCDQSSIAKAYKKIDLFGVPVHFNYGGEEKIKSIPGALVSVMLCLVLAAFAF